MNRPKNLGPDILDPQAAPAPSPERPEPAASKPAGGVPAKTAAISIFSEPAKGLCVSVLRPNRGQDPGHALPRDFLSGVRYSRCAKRDHRRIPR